MMILSIDKSRKEFELGLRLSYSVRVVNTVVPHAKRFEKGGNTIMHLKN
jgi:hypothetical protein